MFPIILVDPEIVEYANPFKINFVAIPKVPIYPLFASWLVDDFEMGVN